ncbi:hypothetical protein MASR1M90_23720 [Desulfovibrionales bacterium]
MKIKNHTIPLSIMSTLKSKIYLRLKEIREQSGLSTNRFAEALGMSQPAWSRLENNRAEPSARTIIALIEKFQVEPLWLLTGESREKIKSPTVLKLAKVTEKLSAESQQRILDLAERELMLEEVLATQRLEKAASD